MTNLTIEQISLLQRLAGERYMLTDSIHSHALDDLLRKKLVIYQWRDTIENQLNDPVVYSITKITQRGRSILNRLDK
jgi:hypothetical protein